MQKRNLHAISVKRNPVTDRAIEPSFLLDTVISNLSSLKKTSNLPSVKVVPRLESGQIADKEHKVAATEKTQPKQLVQITSHGQRGHGHGLITPSIFSPQRKKNYPVKG